MNNATKLGAGVAGGYLLGRTKKLKLAVGLGAWLMGKKLNLSPSQLAMQGLGQLRETPEFGELSDRLRTEVGGAGKRALAAAATSRMDSIADRLADRNDRLVNGGSDDDDFDEDEQSDEYDELDDEDDVDNEGDEPVDEYDDEEADADDVDEPVDEYDDEDEPEDDEPVDEYEDEDEPEDDEPVDEYEDEDEPADEYDEDEDEPADEYDDEDEPVDEYDGEHEEDGAGEEMSDVDAYPDAPDRPRRRVKSSGNGGGSRRRTSAASGRGRRFVSTRRR